MSAVIGSVPDVVSGTGARGRVRIGTVDPAALALLKQLDPIAVMLTLFGCVLLHGERMSHTTLGLGLLTFLISSPILGRSPHHGAVARIGWWADLSPILIEWTKVVAILLFLGFVFNVGAPFSRVVALSWFCATPITLLFMQRLRLRARSILAEIHPPRYIIVGANNVGFELFRRLPQKGFLGFFDFRSADRVSQTINPVRLTGHCKDIASYARGHGIAAIYIALPLSNVPRIGEMIHELRDTTASIYFVPDVFAFDLIQGKLIDVNGMPAISVCDTPFHGMDAVLKRCTDLVLASLALIAAAPLMTLIAFGVKLSSRGPVLFRQRRYGLNGEEIGVYKFRSMTVCEDGAVVRQACAEDDRVTRFGRFIRRTSLDELPQLFNVLQGTMSLVGPRPHAVAHNEKYRRLISGYMIRHKVRPGITGLAQVQGLRGETQNVEKMAERVRYDLEYLRNWSPWLDIKILFRSLAVIWSDYKSTY